MQNYNPLAAGHVTDTAVNLEDGRKFWVLTEQGHEYQDSIKTYMEVRGYEFISATVTTETALKIFQGWARPLTE